MFPRRKGLWAAKTKRQWNGLARSGEDVCTVVGTSFPIGRVHFTVTFGNAPSLFSEGTYITARLCDPMVAAAGRQLLSSRLTHV